MKSLFTSSKKYVIIESPSKKLMYGTKRAARGDIMVKKEMIAMLLAGGQGSRLGVLTQKVAKSAESTELLISRSATASTLVLILWEY